MIPGFVGTGPAFRSNSGSKRLCCLYVSVSTRFSALELSAYSGASSLVIKTLSWGTNLTDAKATFKSSSSSVAVLGPAKVCRQIPVAARVSTNSTALLLSTRVSLGGNAADESKGEAIVQWASSQIVKRRERRKHNVTGESLSRFGRGCLAGRGATGPYRCATGPKHLLRVHYDWKDNVSPRNLHGQDPLPDEVDVMGLGIWSEPNHGILQEATTDHDA